MASIIILVAAIVWPAIAIGWVCVQQGQPPRDGFAFSGGQFALLARTFLLAIGGVAACMPIATAAGVLLGSRRLSQPALAVVAAGLLCPPMVFAFGWQRFLPNSIDPYVRCVLTWTLWAWPAAALIIAAAWSRIGSEPFRAATLHTTALQAWLHVGLPALRPYLFLVALLLFVVFFSDYGVPHGFGLRVYTTELLAWSTASDRVIDVLWPALPPITLTASALAGILWITSTQKDHEPAASTSRHIRNGRTSLVLLLMLAGWVLPLLALLRPLTASVFRAAWRTYWSDLLSTIAVAGVAGVLVITLGVGFAFSRRARRTWLFVALLFGAVPGAAIGQAFIAAYNRQPTEWLYDHWPIVSLVYVARYAWIGLLIADRIALTASTTTLEQAYIDGATDFQALRYVLLPQHAPVLWGGAAIVIALAVGDVAASQLIRVPGYNPIALLILDKFHQFQDGMLISLSLMLTGLAALCAMAIGQVWRSARSGTA